MTSKTKIVKFIQSRIQINEKIQRQTSQSDQLQQEQINVRKKKPRQQKQRKNQIILTKKYLILNLSLKSLPLNENYMANFYNIILINESSLRTKDHWESYTRTSFYLKQVKSVEIYPLYLILHLSDSSNTFAPLQYTINRFKSFGDQRFFNIAQKMKSLQKYIIKFRQKPALKANEKSLKDNFEQIVSIMGNKRYAMRFFGDTMVISKSLLKLLQIDPEQFAIETVKFKSPLHEPTSNESYYDFSMVYFSWLQNSLRFALNQISLQKFIDESMFRGRNTLYTSSNKKITTKSKFSFIRPFVNAYQVEQVIGIEEELQFSTKSKHHFQDLKTQLKKQQAFTISRLMQNEEVESQGRKRAKYIDFIQQ